jgi:glutathione S-transferase
VFLVAGLLFAWTQPPLVLAQCMLYGYAAARLAHFWAYFTAKPHEVRATFFSIGSLLVIAMAVYSFICAVR